MLRVKPECRSKRFLKPRHFDSIARWVKPPGHASRFGAALGMDYPPIPGGIGQMPTLPLI